MQKVRSFLELRTVMHSCVCLDVEKQVNTFTARSFHSLEARSTQNLSLSLTPVE